MNPQSSLITRRGRLVMKGVTVRRMVGLGLAAVATAALLPGGPAVAQTPADEAETATEEVFVGVVDTGGASLRIRPSAATVQPPRSEERRAGKGGKTE